MKPGGAGDQGRVHQVIGNCRGDGRRRQNGVAGAQPVEHQGRESHEECGLARVEGVLVPGEPQLHSPEPYQGRIGDQAHRARQGCRSGLKNDGRSEQDGGADVGLDTLAHGQGEAPGSDDQHHEQPNFGQRGSVPLHSHVQVHQEGHAASGY